MMPSSSEPAHSFGFDVRPTLTKEQEADIFLAAGRRVMAAVRQERAKSSRETLGAVADTPIFGSFVTLKRSGQLRSCCGCLGEPISLADALDQAADRAATSDPRFPPIAEEELSRLDMHVWLLWGPQPLAERGEDRVGAIEIGKHGLQIIRGHSRGLLLPSVAVEHHLDARGFLQQVCLKAGLPRDAWKSDDTTLLVFEGYAMEGPLKIDDGDVRPPAVAGGFYPGTPGEIQHALDELFAASAKATVKPWSAALIPHAGWVYSGRLAAAVLRQVEIPDCVLVFCPKHRVEGALWAVAPHARWAFPGGEVASDPAMAIRLASAIDGLELDALPHRQEHAIEVQLPFLARLAPQTRVVGIVVGERPLPNLLHFGSQLAQVIYAMPKRPLLVISSDMNHFANDADTRRLDQLALDAIQTLDPVNVHETVQRNRISMCGAAACIVVMEALRHLDALRRCEIVGHATSAESSGDTRRVVGYAGVLFE
jgi:AmmeMemoRadiSam system protein B/AmmeMemoRadiSam system protein A